MPYLMEYKKALEAVALITKLSSLGATLTSEQDSLFENAKANVIRANNEIADFLIHAQTARGKAFTEEELSLAIKLIMEHENHDLNPGILATIAERKAKGDWDAEISATKLTIMTSALAADLAKYHGASISHSSPQYEENAALIAGLFKAQLLKATVSMPTPLPPVAPTPATGTMAARGGAGSAPPPSTAPVIAKVPSKTRVINEFLIEAQSFLGLPFSADQMTRAKKLMAEDINYEKIVRLAKTDAKAWSKDNASNIIEKREMFRVLQESLVTQTVRPKAEDERAVYGGSRTRERIATAEPRDAVKKAAESTPSTGPASGLLHPLPAGGARMEAPHASTVSSAAPTLPEVLPVSSAAHSTGIAPPASSVSGASKVTALPEAPVAIGQREQLMQSLRDYISRIESHKKPGGQIDFAYGFHFYKNSQAINREANYLLAKQMLEQLSEPSNKIENIFNAKAISASRSLLASEHHLTTRADYVDRGINSSDLNEIIKSGQKASEPSAPDSGAGVQPAPENEDNATKGLK